jgi:hypothetical protein
LLPSVRNGSGPAGPVLNFYRQSVGPTSDQPDGSIPFAIRTGPSANDGYVVIGIPTSSETA